MECTLSPCPAFLAHPGVAPRKVYGGKTRPFGGLRPRGRSTSFKRRLWAFRWAAFGRRQVCDGEGSLWAEPLGRTFPRRRGPAFRARGPTHERVPGRNPVSERRLQGSAAAQLLPELFPPRGGLGGRVGDRSQGGGGPLCLPATSSPPPALSPIGRRFTGGPRPQPWRLIYAKTCEPCSRRSHSPHQWFLNPPLSVPKLREPGWRGSAQTQDRRPSGGGRTPHSRGPHRGRPEAAPPGGLKTVANPGQEGTFQNGLSKRS